MGLPPEPLHRRNYAQPLYRSNTITHSTTNTRDRPSVKPMKLSINSETPYYKWNLE